MCLTEFVVTRIGRGEAFAGVHLVIVTMRVQSGSQKGCINAPDVLSSWPLSQSLYGPKLLPGMHIMEEVLLNSEFCYLFSNSFFSLANWIFGYTILY